MKKKTFEGMSTSKVGNDDDDEDYTHFYRKFVFEQDSNEPIKSISAKRMQIILNHYHSIKNDEEKTTSYLLEKDLSEYSNMIDNKNGVNNYAQYIKALSGLVSHSTSDYSKWTSSLQPILQTSNVVDSNKTTDEYVEKCFLNLKRNLTEKNRKLPNEVTQVTKKMGICNFENKNLSPHENFGTSFSNASTKRNVSNYSRNTRFELSNEPIVSNEPCSGFRTAKTELKIQNIKKYGNKGTDHNQIREVGAIKRSLGGRTRTVNSKFIPPIKHEENEIETNFGSEQEVYEDERLKNLDPKMIELIKNEIMDHGKPISWDDIAGLQFAKTTIQEIVVWPLLRPDIFTGLRRPPKGILLFGPPGTGKTLIGKCIASQSSSTFFSISASSLTSKWIGESEKLVRTLFAVARCYQPAVIFIDEIDSLLSQRSETEHESSRRIKTEFLVQLDGATTHEDDRILVIGATNRPQELDEAARRRLVKRLYIPLPEFEARCQIVNRLMGTERNDLTEADVNEIAKLTDGYSGADMKNLCQEASLGPIRSIDFSQITSIQSHAVRPVTLTDFISALKHVRSSVSPSDLVQYLEWDKIYGSSGN